MGSVYEGGGLVMRVGVQVTGKNEWYCGTHKQPLKIGVLSSRHIIGRNVRAKHIPIECWSEAKANGIIEFIDVIDVIPPVTIRNSGGKTYLVSTISHISMSLGEQL